MVNRKGIKEPIMI